MPKAVKPVAVPPVACYSESTEVWPTAPPRGSSNADVVSYVQALKMTVRAAWADRACVREWARIELGGKP